MAEEHGWETGGGAWEEGGMSAMWSQAPVLHMATAATHVLGLSHNWNYQQLLMEVVGRRPHHVDHRGRSSCLTHAWTDRKSPRRPSHSQKDNEWWVLIKLK